MSSTSNCLNGRHTDCTGYGWLRDQHKVGRCGCGCHAEERADLRETIAELRVERPAWATQTDEIPF